MFRGFESLLLRIACRSLSEGVAIKTQAPALSFVCNPDERQAPLKGGGTANKMSAATWFLEGDLPPEES
jgi:hypothetical protein